MTHKTKVKNSLIVIVGPTASGKSEYAVKLAKKVDGEIISADSRQIYKGMDIGSGKVPGKWKNFSTGKLGGKKSSVGKSDPRRVFMYKNVPHYLIDVASPRRQYNAARFQREASKTIQDILNRGRVPIISGGTAHWVDVVVFNQVLPEVKPDRNLRAKLAKYTTAEVYKKLQKLDPARAREIDSHNPRRLMRALEIVMSTGQPVPKLASSTNANQKYKIQWIGLNPSQDQLEKKIKLRLKQRLKAGMLKEVQKLHKLGVSWRRLESFGLEYKFCALYLQKKLKPKNTLAELEKQLFTAIRQYAKRQKTWWKRNKEIEWQK